MKEHAKEYRKKLEHEIIELMQMPCNERTAEAIVDLAECYEKVMALEEGSYHHVLSDEEIKRGHGGTGRQYQGFSAEGLRRTYEKIKRYLIPKSEQYLRDI